MIETLLSKLLTRLNELDRRVTGTEFRGRVEMVDIDTQRVRLRIGTDPDGNAVLSPWTPYKQTAGAMRFHNPPSVGQSMKINSEAGDLQQGLAEPYHWSDGFEAISNNPDQHRMVFGDVAIEVNESSVVISVGGVTWTLDANGEHTTGCLLYTSPSPRDQRGPRMPSSA